MSALGNRRAFLEGVLAGCEGTQGEEGYRALFGWRPGNGKVFTSFADHPRIFVDYTDQSGKRTRTSAAGKFQATWTTWQDFIRERGPHDFSPASQDEFALWLIQKCSALDDVDAGRLRAAIDKCGGRWASLPSATVPQPRRTYEFCERQFLAAGGVLEGTAAPIAPQPQPAPAQPTTPAAPSPQREEKSTMPVPAIALGLAQTLLPQILGLFSGRAQATIAEKTGADPTVAKDFVNGLIKMAGDATGIPVTDDRTAIAAVGKLVTDVQPGTPAAKQLEDASLDYLHDLTEAAAALVAIRKDEVQIETTSMDAASRRDDASEVRRRIDSKVWWAYAIAALILASIAIAQLVVKQDVDGQIVGALILAFGALGGIVQMMAAYGYGSTANSGAKDVVIGEIASRRAGK